MFAVSVSAEELTELEREQCLEKWELVSELVDEIDYDNLDKYGVGLECLEKIDQSGFNRSRDYFALGNICRSIRLYVLFEEENDDVIKIGLTKDQITTTVRSRLRGARLYSTKGNGSLKVSVNVVGSAFSIGFYFEKSVIDGQWVAGDVQLNSDNSRVTGMVSIPRVGIGSAITWKRVLTGTHSEEASFILSGVAQGTDHFIDEYLG